MCKEMTIEDVIAQLERIESDSLSRDLVEVMYDEYEVTEQIKHSVAEQDFIFPVYNNHKQNELVLTRKQNYFSAKPHHTHTPVYFHKHQFVEAIYVYRGECRQYIESDTHEITLKECDFMLLNQNVTHAIRETSEQDIIIKMIIPLDFIREDVPYDKFDSKMLRDFFTQSLLPNNKTYNYIIFRQNKDDKVKEIIDKLILEYYEQKIYYESAIKMYLYLLFIELLRGYEECESEYYKIGKDSVDLKEVLEHIEVNHRDITLKGAAEYFGYNDSYFSRLIHKETGKTFQKIVNESRLQKTLFLLRNTDLPMEIIAERIGYKNVTNLYRMFKSTYGITPVEYRQGIPINQK